MTSSGLVVAGATTLALSFGVPAVNAGASRICRLVVDEARDDRGGGEWSGGSLDLTSADVASDGRFLTLVIRLRDLTETSTSPSGGNWEFAFSLPGGRFFANANRAPDGEEFHLEYLAESVGDENGGAATFGYLGRIDGVVDEDLSEVRMHVPVALLRPYGLRAGAAIGKLRAESRTHVGTTTQVPIFRSFPTGAVSGGHNPAGGDVAASRSTYRAGSASCVAPGQ